jgi:hypothetical protein
MKKIQVKAYWFWRKTVDEKIVNSTIEVILGEHN